MNEIGPMVVASPASADTKEEDPGVSEPSPRRGFAADEIGWIMRIYLYAVLIYFSGAVVRPLSGNADQFVDVGESPTIQYIGIALYALSLPIFMRVAIAGIRRRRLPAPIVLCAIAVALWICASIQWSANPAISTRRAIAYAGSLMIVFTLAFAIPPREVIRALVWITIGILVVTAALYIADPTYAVHQAGEIGVAEHAGRLRGTFSHKNEFARMVAAGFAVLLLFGRAVVRSWLLWLAILALGVALLLLAGSAKIVIGLPIALAAVWLVRIPIAPAYRFFALVLVGVPLMLVYSSGMLDAAMDAVFGSLGRTAGMSGRDEIWEAAWHSIARHPVFGQGYYAGWANEAQAEILMRKYISLGHAHNGFLETLLDLGAIGLVLALIPLLYIAVRALAVPPGRVQRLQALATMWIVLDVTLNFAGSYLINYNDLYPTMTLLLCFWFVRLDRGSIDELSFTLFSIPPRRVKQRLLVSASETRPTAASSRDALQAEV